LGCNVLSIDGKGDVVLLGVSVDDCSYTPPPVDNECGPADGGTFNTFPAATACTLGSPLFSGPNTFAGVPWGYTRHCPDADGNV
jgi:hypothetical protein